MSDVLVRLQGLQSRLHKTLSFALLSLPQHQCPTPILGPHLVDNPKATLTKLEGSTPFVLLEEKRGAKDGAPRWGGSADTLL